MRREVRGVPSLDGAHLEIGPAEEEIVERHRAVEERLGLRKRALGHHRERAHVVVDLRDDGGELLDLGEGDVLAQHGLRRALLAGFT